MTMKKTIILMLACMCVFMNASAQRNSGRSRLEWDCCMRTAWT